jgi:hypothetical protein
MNRKISEGLIPKDDIRKRKEKSLNQVKNKITQI